MPKGFNQDEARYKLIFGTEELLFPHEKPKNSTSNR